MGYFHNHLATLVMGVFTAILTGLWPIFVDFAPVLNFVFMMAVPIAWFITFMCWIVQKGADYSHRNSVGHSLKKNYNNSQKITQVYTSDGKLLTHNRIAEAKTQLSNELDQLRNTVKLKENEIEHLKQEISNLQTMVQIESLKSELANLKMLASKDKKRKLRKK
jgi:hypothetical protein